MQSGDSHEDDECVWQRIEYDLATPFLDGEQSPVAGCPSRRRFGAMGLTRAREGSRFAGVLDGVPSMHAVKGGHGARETAIAQAGASLGRWTARDLQIPGIQLYYQIQHTVKQQN